MAVAHDKWSESHTGTTGSTSEASFSWTHSPVGTPKGVLVFVITNADADDVTSVTYGGVAVPAVTGGEAADTAGEPGRCKAFFLGSGLPTGDQTVVVNRVNNADELAAWAVTVTAGADTEVYEPGIVLLQENQTLAEVNVDDGSPGTDSLRYAFINSGLGSPMSVGANTFPTASEGVPPVIDFGARVAKGCRENAAGQGSRPMGFSSGTSEDVAAVHLAVREAAATELPLELGDIPASSAAHGIDLSQSGPVALSLGDVPGASAAHGVDLTAAGPLALSLGDIPSTEVVRGIDLAGAVLALELGAIPSAEVVRGIDLTAAGPLALSLGDIPSTDSVFGIDLALSPVALDLLLGAIPSAEVVQGIDLTIAGPLTLSLGDIPASSAAHGINLAGSVLSLLLGNVPAADVAHGITLAQSGPISLPLGKITSGLIVHGVTLSQSGAVSLLLGNVVSAEVVRGVGLVLELPEKTTYVLQADFEDGVRVVEVASGVFAVEFEGGVGRLEYEGGVLLSEYSDGVKVVDF